jgi:hypothetical protein
VATRGRPKGSKNKKQGLGREYLKGLFKSHDFEPGEFLIQVANGTEQSGKWRDQDRLKACQILMAHTYDKPQRESEQALIEQLRAHQQEHAPVYEIVYVQDQTGFTLPPEASTAVATG